MEKNYSKSMLVSGLATAILLFCFIIHFSSYNCVDLTKPLFISLDGDRWTAFNSSSSLKIKGSVPGGIYSDLKNARILKEDIFFGKNDIEYRWVGKENWTYTTAFQVANNVMQKKNVWIVFHGLDTVSEILLNNVLIGKSDNMFVRYRFDVKKHLKIGVNNLEVKFRSPIWAAEKYSSYSNYSIPPECPTAEQNGECHVNFLRKMQASFSWDWGPAFPSVGIWKNVQLEAFDSAIIRSASVSVSNTSNYWIVSGTVYLDSTPGSTITGLAEVNIVSATGELFFPGSQQVQVNAEADASGQASFNISRLHVQQDVVKLWWPNGYGDQNLYHLNVTFYAQNEYSSILTQFGFRTAKLVQKPVDPGKRYKGLTFYFEINGIKVFAKGSNYIPAHILPELSSNEATLRNLLGAAKDTHMNMLRVWGGGLYESELFYKLCDELGIMIWQDMMFACAMYTTNGTFLDSVSTEIVQQVRRLHSYPSIVLWAGNNENEAALTGNWYHTKSEKKVYSTDYVKLYVDVIKRLVETNDGTRSYVVSSPSNGLQSEREGYLSNNPYSPLFGDVHIYNYFADNWDMTNVGPTRFSSEYGIQSLPSYATLNEALPVGDLIPSSEALNLRQHHAAGYFQIEEEINMNLPDFNKTNIHQWIYYSQINQAMSMKTMTERYRQMRDTIDNNGYGLTMGALYWQLNDVWQAPSWSSIEYGGKWKMLHYFAEKFFSPILLSPWIEFDDNVMAMVISDRHQQPPLQVQIQVLVYRWDSLHPVNTYVSKSRIEPLSSVVVLSQPLGTLVGPQGLCGSEPRKECFLVFRLFTYSGVELSPETFLFLDRLTAIRGLKNAILELKSIKPHSGSFSSYSPNVSQTFEITITTDAVALFVWLDVGSIKGRFSDNGFLMVSREKKVTFVSWEPTSETELAKALTISTVKGSQVKTDKDEGLTSTPTSLSEHLTAPSKASIVTGMWTIMMILLHFV